MPHSVAQLPEAPSAGPPRASEREEPERLPGRSMRAKSSNTTICQRHLMQAERHRMCLERRPIDLCNTYPPHRGWPNGRCKQSSRRRPNLVHLAGLPHCQLAGVDCAWVLHCRNRASETEVPARLTASNTLLLLVHDATLYGCVGSVATAKGTIIQQPRR